MLLQGRTVLLVQLYELLELRLLQILLLSELLEWILVVSEQKVENLVVIRHSGLLAIGH